ncbi:hypothetical protein JCM10450v2_005858 [Rhodotorula kratochvilovae]
MTTLKSALRFPPAHPPPPPPPPEPQYPNLTSRFSAETLLIKSPPRPFQRLFSSSTTASASPPPSPPAGTVKRYHRRVSSQKGIYRHAPSASESRLVVSSPKAYDLPETPTRASMDDVRPQPQSRRSRSLSRARATSGTAADKLAGAAKEVLEKFSLRRHGRQGSHSSGHSAASGESVESLASPRRSRSLSSPSPGPHKVEHHPPPPPTRRPPPRPLNPPFTLVDLPPRSDSRNALVADLPSVAGSSSLGGSSRSAHLPTLAATRPRPKHLALQAPPPPRAHLRPVSPPSPSIPPLRPARAPAAPPAAGGTAHPFHAMLVKAPTRQAVRARAADELLVRIDVGGQSTYMTSVATLAGPSAQAGRLGEFVDAVLEDARRGAPAVEDEAPCEEGAPQHPYLQLPAPGSDGDASSSSLSLTPSFAPSPYPSSPFPFADDMSTYSGCPGAGGGFDDEDPMSPIDPLVNSAAAARAAKDLLLALPPAFSPPPHPLPAQNQAQAVQLVASPTLPHGGKHRSVYPDVGSSVDLGAEGAPLLPFVVSSPAAAPASLAEEAARKALAMRLRCAPSTKRESTASSAAGDDEIRFISPFERGLGPYFDVVRHQLHSPAGDSLLSPCWPAESCPSPSPITAAMALPSPRAVERRSLDYGLLPSDVEGYGSEEEHRSRSTVLGVPRGLSRRTLDGLHALPAARDEVPEVPKLAVERDEARDGKSRTGTPSLSMSVTTVDDDEDALGPGPEGVSLEDATVVLFLDRTDAPLLSLSSLSDGHAPTSVTPGLTLYGAILAFLRTGALPSALLLPRHSSPPAKSTSPDVDPLYISLFALSPAPLFALLSALRTLSDEAAWLGLAALERACADELARLGGVVRWLADAKEGAGARKARKEGVKGAAREKEGWI